MFIWGEDSEYTRRVTKQHPGYLVGDSHVVHVRGVAGLPRIETEVDPVRIGWHAYYVRNLLYNHFKHVGRRSALSMVQDRIRQVVRLFFRGEVTKASIIARGLISYLSFRPEIEDADAPISTLGVSSSLLQTIDHHHQGAAPGPQGGSLVSA